MKKSSPGLVNVKYLILLFHLSVCICSTQTIFSQQKAVFTTTGSNLVIQFGEQTVANIILPASGTDFRYKEQDQVVNNCVYQLFTITSVSGKPINISGAITADSSSISCESDPRESGLKIVRAVSGASHSLLNNAVYNREDDWLVSFDHNNTKMVIRPEVSGKIIHYQFSITGNEIIIRFRPDYYQKHRGLTYFHPKEYAVYQKPVVGWCSWFAYFDKVTEANVIKTADIISEKFKPFGLSYLQIDDGYQQNPIGSSTSWLIPNQKFPSGLEKLAKYISNKGLQPGIWTNVSFTDSAAAYQNRTLFVRDKNNTPVSGNWIGYVMDGNQPATIEKFIAPVYKTLNQFGWQYFKLDALRHLKYEGYNSYKEFFDGKSNNRDSAFRKIVQTVRKEVGKDHFLLACWGIRPELVGIADGCRIGNDGYSYAGLAQYNSYNNIIWRNDPDHIVLSQKEAYRSCTATSLTGSLFMLTDKPEVYEFSPLIEAAQRTIPVLFTQPGQVYDVDPSRSAHIGLYEAEMSGSGPRVFDAGTATTTGLFSLEVNRVFENWLVLGRMDERDNLIPVKDLGLDPNKQYLCFEFWTKKFMGIVNKQFSPGTIDSNYHCQVFCFREKLSHPQLLATNRHVSCGGFEINEMNWSENALSGTSELVANDLYVIYVYEPDISLLKDIKLEGADLISNKKEGNIRMITTKSSHNATLHWSFIY